MTANMKDMSILERNLWGYSQSSGDDDELTDAMIYRVEHFPRRMTRLGMNLNESE